MQDVSRINLENQIENGKTRKEIKNKHHIQFKALTEK